MIASQVVNVELVFKIVVLETRNDELKLVHVRLEDLEYVNEYM